MCGFGKHRFDLLRDRDARAELVGGLRFESDGMDLKCEGVVRKMWQRVAEEWNGATRTACGGDPFGDREEEKEVLRVVVKREGGHSWEGRVVGISLTWSSENGGWFVEEEVVFL